MRTLPAFESGCLLRGQPLDDGDAACEQRSSSCGRAALSAMACPAGHFVCDACHGAPAEEFIAGACLASTDTDMTRMLRRLRLHPAFTRHGPEHHACLAAIAAHDAARCGQRDAFIALTVAAEPARGLLGVAPTADERLVCTQVARNRDCEGACCEPHPEHEGRGTGSAAAREFRRVVRPEPRT